MAIPIITNWQRYFSNPHEGLGSSYERIILNNKLLDIVQKYGISDVIETPCFGFTGLSGINSMELAKRGCSVTLEDHDQDRLDLIDAVWKECGISVNTSYNADYHTLEYESKSFDMLWNFSAMWFIRKPDALDGFLAEAVRITRKAILICVPNQNGLGFILQKAESTEGLEAQINPEHINPNLIIRKLEKLKWKLVETDFIDCPPWPDIGMGKEEFLNRWCTICKLRNKLKNGSCKIAPPPAKTISIMDYYRATDPSFPERMMRFYPFERYLPSILKSYWAHHRYLLFLPK